MKDRPMRWVFCMLMVFGLASPALAADLDVLRGPDSAAPSVSVGPATFTRWSGFYFGGHIGYTNGNSDLSGSTGPLIAYSLRNTTLEQSFSPSQWPVLAPANNSALTYGGFLGYNSQWQDLTLGVEANLNRAGFTLRAPSTPISLRTGADSSGTAYDVTVSGNGSVTNMDFATLRATAGYVVGNFRPYAFGGLALGLTTVSISSVVSGEQYTSGSTTVCTVAAPCFPLPTYTNAFGANSAVLYGFTAGGGIDVALTSNIFLRAEFEWDQFKPPPGFLMTVATGRVGAGLKF
jgi:outer membrane immunogenic protein